MAESNPMQQIFIDKVVLNIGIGSNENLYQNAKMLLEKLTSHQPVQTLSKRRVPELKIRRGQVIGAMVTLRNEEAYEMLRRAIEANDDMLKNSSISNNSLSFGVKEYIYFSGVKYDPKIGMLGLNVNASFTRKGRRIETRKRKQSKSGLKHKRIPDAEIAKYLESKYNAKIVER